MTRPGEAVRLIHQDLPYLQEGSPFIRLTGDSFVSSTESALYLLKNVNQTVGGGSLTNVGTTPFTFDADFGNTVAVLNGSSQYFSYATDSTVQVGTSSFMSSIAFKTTTTGVLQAIYSYGSHATGKGYWEARISSGNQLIFEIWDGTTTNTITDTIANRWQDGKWHIITALVDKTNNIIYVSCDGANIGSLTVTATATLTIAGENLYVGAYKNSSSTITGFFNGSLGLFKLINNAADYNVSAVWNLGTREAVSSGTYTVPTNDSNKRLNNKFGTPNTNGAYFYTVGFFEDGEYEIQTVYEMGTSNGQLQILVDNNIITWSTGNNYIETYNGSTTHNNIIKSYRMKLSAGAHSIKILNSGKNGSSVGNTVNLQYINFIKRKGHENGGSTNLLLLGDEINERPNTSWTFSVDNSAWYNNNLVQASPADAQYTEGVIYIKGGLYVVTIGYYQQANTINGKGDLWFGNVQVLNQFDFSVAQNGSGHASYTNQIYVRLQQGRQDIRLASNGSSGTGHQIPINSIKLERIAD